MNKTLLKSVREYKKQSVMAPLLVVLEVFMEVLIPLEMAKIIDVGIAQGDMRRICVMIFSIRYRNFRSIISIISPHPDWLHV